MLSLGFVRAADEPAKPSNTTITDDQKKALLKEIDDAWTFYQSQQAKPATAIPNAVVAKAKGVMIINRWSGGVGIGGTGGEGIGMKKDKDGKFSAPAFYNVSGASVGVQLGGSNTKTIAFLMTDKGLNALTDGKMVWGGDARAVAGPSDAATTTLDDSADIILYQQSSGLEVGASVAGVKVALDNDGNRKFYDNPALSPADIFDGKVKMPPSAQPLVDALNKQAAAKK
jgi:lipid-binding SYLF domain-containing protein